MVAPQLQKSTMTPFVKIYWPYVSLDCFKSFKPEEKEVYNTRTFKRYNSKKLTIEVKHTKGDTWETIKKLYGEMKAFAETIEMEATESVLHPNYHACTMDMAQADYPDWMGFTLLITLYK